jgi:hypothetical protein
MKDAGCRMKKRRVLPFILHPASFILPKLVGTARKRAQRVTVLRAGKSGPQQRKSRNVL